MSERLKISELWRDKFYEGEVKRCDGTRIRVNVW